MATKTKAELQAVVKRRVAVSIALALSLVYVAWVYAPIPVPANANPTDRLVFTLRWLSLSLIPIVIGIHLVGSVRRNNMDVAGVNTTSPKAEELVRLRQRTLQNTLEQTALHVPLMLILSTYLDSDSLKLVPICICLFVLARIMYYIGYLTTSNNLGRAYGFAMTFLPTVVLIVYCLYKLFMGGVTYRLSA